MTDEQPNTHDDSSNPQPSAQPDLQPSAQSGAQPSARCDSQPIAQPSVQPDPQSSVQAGAHAVLVECPSCKQPGFIEAWPHINSARDVEAKKLLMDGRLFKYTCPVCGTTVSMTYDCLYHDVEHKALLYYSTGALSEIECIKQLDHLADQAEWDDCIAPGSYQRRLVLTTFEFCEKVRILEDGYDDRVIELMKVAIKRGMLEEGIIGKRDIFVYERTLPNGGVSFITMGEVPGDAVGVPQGYTYLKERMADSLAAVTGEYRYDSAWANRFLP